MKKSFVIIFSFLFLSVFTFSQTKITVRGKYFTSENLNLRSEPSTQAKKIVTVPKHTVVYVIEEGPQEKIDGKIAKWKKVVCDQFENNKQYKAGTTGWVFSAYLAEEDKYTDEEIEKILFETFEFSIGSEDIYGFGFSNYEDKKTIRAFRDSNMPGCYESTGSTFHVKDGKIILDKPFESSENISWDWANECFYNDDGICYLILERVHSTECEFCLVDYEGRAYKSAPKENSLMLENGVLISTETVSIVLPCDCVFYKRPYFSSEKMSFPDYIDLENDERHVLVYNLDRVFKGQKVSASRWLVNEETYNGIQGRWYYLKEICNTDLNYVWIFVPGSLSPDSEEIPLTIKTFTDAQKKGLLRFRVITQEDYELISSTHHHMNPWIESCLDTFPDQKK